MAIARVLIVDDEPLLPEAYARILGRNGYEAFSASRPGQALKLVCCHPPMDVVLSDVAMPEMRGTDLIRKVAQLSPGTACVLMTGGIVHSTELTAGVALLRKPLSQRDLIAAVERAIAYTESHPVR